MYKIFVIIVLATMCLGQPIDYDYNEPATDVNNPAMGVDEPALDSNEPALNSNEPSLNSNEPALDSNEPALNSNEPATDVNEQTNEVEEGPLSVDDSEQVNATPVPPIDETIPAVDGTFTAEDIFSRTPLAPQQDAITVQEPVPVEFAQPGLVGEIGSQLDKETIDYAAPSVSLVAPAINLPKGAMEVVDVPHAHIDLPGNSMVNKDVFLNLPSPVIEAPKPIIREKEVLFRIPQPVFYVPRPIIQHKPIIYRLGHTLRAITPIVSTRQYVFRVPQAQIAGKSAYTQPIPQAYKQKSIYKKFH